MGCHGFSLYERASSQGRTEALRPVFFALLLCDGKTVHRIPNPPRCPQAHSQRGEKIITIPSKKVHASRCLHCSDEGKRVAVYSTQWVIISHKIMGGKPGKLVLLLPVFKNFHLHFPSHLFPNEAFNWA